MKRRAMLAMLAILSACQKVPATTENEAGAGSALDQQAIAAGILPDPKNVDFAGRFETRGDLGTDKFCAVRNGARQFDIGVLAMFGPESKCEGQGSAIINGDKVRIELRGRGDCAFDAQYDGVELRFPGLIAPGCASYCADRASLSGTHYFMVQPGSAAARNTLGRDIERLCG
jgi:hypothetical protein